MKIIVSLVVILLVSLPTSVLGSYDPYGINYTFIEWARGPRYEGGYIGSNGAGFASPGPSRWEMVFDFYMPGSDDNNLYWCIVIWDGGPDDMWRITKGRYPYWSPCGEWILYVREKELGDGIWEFYKIRPDGTDETRLTHSTVDKGHSHGHWSYDGKHIVYSRTYEGGPSQLVVVDAKDFSNERVIHEVHGEWARIITPRFTYDDRILFASNEWIQVKLYGDRPNTSIGIININGSNRKRLTSGYIDSHPTMHPSGIIAFTSWRTYKSYGWGDDEPRWFGDVYVMYEGQAPEDFLVRNFDNRNTTFSYCGTQLFYKGIVPYCTGDLYQ